MYYDVVGVINDFGKDEYFKPQKFQVNITIDKLNKNQYYATLSAGPQDDDKSVMYSINITRLFDDLKEWIHENDK